MQLAEEFNTGCTVCRSTSCRLTRHRRRGDRLARDSVPVLPVQMSKEDLVQSLRRQHKGYHQTSSRFRGVTKHQKGKWEARIGQARAVSFPHCVLAQRCGDRWFPPRSSASRCWCKGFSAAAAVAAAAATAAAAAPSSILRLNVHASG